ncbi:MAG: FAD-dependent oxidoreductase, partial [Kiritimatiellae bacterium]|nr:FAD-dependent oxidoreductase [Kiritimatiellia bacterium]
MLFDSCDFEKCQIQNGESPRPLFHVEQFPQLFHVEHENLGAINSKSNEAVAKPNVHSVGTAPGASLLEHPLRGRPVAGEYVCGGRGANALPGFATTSTISNVPRGTLPELPCWLTHTTAKTHEIIRSGLAKSALYGGKITGTGVRYCPSIEDKIVRFASANQHHVMLEPEDS